MKSCASCIFWIAYVRRGQSSSASRPVRTRDVAGVVAVIELVDALDDLGQERLDFDEALRTARAFLGDREDFRLGFVEQLPDLLAVGVVEQCPYVMRSIACLPSTTFRGRGIPEEGAEPHKFTTNSGSKHRFSAERPVGYPLGLQTIRVPPIR